MKVILRVLLAVASLALTSVAHAHGRDRGDYDCREVHTTGRVFNGVYHTAVNVVCGGEVVDTIYTAHVRPRWDDTRVVIDDPYRGRHHHHHHHHRRDHRDDYRDVPVVRVTPPRVVIDAPPVEIRLPRIEIPRPPHLHIGGHHGGVHIDLRLGGR